MNRLPISHPAIDFMIVYLRGRIAHARDEDTSRGASAVEWVVISAIVVAIVGAIGFAINNALQTKSGKVSDCIQSTTNTSKC
jgi:Flp pilus assembly pilin Flp